MITFFKKPKKAIFISRSNRFTVQCELEGSSVKAFLPNTGRLAELLLPGAVIYLEEANIPERKIPFTAVAVEKNNCPVMIHTHKTNDVAQHLIEKGLVPQLEGAKILKREVKEGGSRFDFLLRKHSEDIFLEVKSCTLFSEKVAMFPDAVTSRGKKHIDELVHLSEGKAKGAVLFLVQSKNVDFFLPEYHRDSDFTKALLAARDKILIIPLAIGWTDNLSLCPEVKLLKISWDILENEAGDRGSYLVVLKLLEDSVIQVGKLGEIAFSKGYYVYVGSAMKNLAKRIERHRRLRKKMFWHIDYFRQKAEFVVALPVQAGDNLECLLAADLRKISDWEIRDFGSSDCSCDSHLFGFKENPIYTRELHRVVQYYRMDRLFK